VFTAFLRVLFVKWLEPLARGLSRVGISPNAITVVGTIGTIAAAVVFVAWRGAWMIGSFVIAALTLFDAMDGLVARVGGTSSPFGAVLDSTCDRFADAAVFGAIGWYWAGHGQRWLLLASLLCLVLGSVTSYVRSRAEAAGYDAKVGIAERTDRLIIALAGTFLIGAPWYVPYLQAIALWLLAGLSAITIGQRLNAVYRQAKGRAGSVPGTAPAAADSATGATEPSTGATGATT
jgi:CDP-diacylglycerol--glycerol-3-phosphate 3-phosphatidyltransferase